MQVSGGTVYDETLQLPRTVYRIAVAAVLCATISPRALLLLYSDFPVNDGGLFLVFIEEIVKTFPDLPTHVTYNGHVLPFSYPPLSFYLYAMLARLGLDPLDLVRYGPIITNIGLVFLFYALLREHRFPNGIILLALAIFGLSLRSFEWLVMGGGVSRGLGSLFFVLVLILVARSEQAPSVRTEFALLTGAALCVALAGLSHLEWGMLAAAAAVIQLGLNRRSFGHKLSRLALVATISVAAASPWFWSVVSAHGLAPFRAASKTSAWSDVEGLKPLRDFFRPTHFAPFIIIGLYAQAKSRRYLWPLLSLCSIVLTPRHGPTAQIMFTAIMAAQGVEQILLWFERTFRSTLTASGSRLGVLGRSNAVFAFALFGMSVLAAAQGFMQAVGNRNMEIVPAAARSAMIWVAENRPNAVAAVINDKSWFADAVAEWYPVLSNGTNTTTLQGSEWLPGDAFTKKQKAIERLKHSSSCNEMFANLAGLEPVTIYWVQEHKACFEQRPEFKKIYENAFVSIFQRAG